MSDVRAFAKALLRYRFEDCPDCYARRELLADSRPLSPGSQHTVVIPKGWKIEHTKSCPTGQLMAEAAQLCGASQTDEQKGKER